MKQWLSLLWHNGETLRSDDGFFCTFLSSHCTTGLEHAYFHVLKRKYTSDEEISSLFLDLDVVLSSSTLGGFTYIHLEKLVTWRNRDEDWKNTNSLVQQRFRCRRRPPILKVPNETLAHNKYLFMKNDNLLLFTVSHPKQTHNVIRRHKNE